MIITSVSPQGRRSATDRASLLGPQLREAARAETNRWIKRLRLVRYDGVSMRERFTYRGESLWWFTELYLHKMRRLEAAVETVLALDEARRAGAARLAVATADPASREAARAFGRARGLPVEIEGRDARDRPGLSSALIGWTGRLSRLRPGRPRPPARPAVAAFVHTAFWRATVPEQETYIGPILDALIARAGREAIACIGLGPRRNFRARRWWDPVAQSGAPGPIISIERLAPGSAIREALRLWRGRRRLADDIVNGPDIRASAMVCGCDLWPVLRHELRGAALIQWPWSARSMDEAGAAIEALEPRVVVTYAEAGGWGRALMIEARRRGVPSVGIQHGFIYRHWLNYLHEPDEMAPLGADLGFPRPDKTLLFDDYAAQHLEREGHFPAASLVVTGNARLEALDRRVARTRGRRDEIRATLGVASGAALAVLAAKHAEIKAELPELVQAVSRMPYLMLAIKTHPAETPEVYRQAADAGERVTVLPASADLAELLAAADVIVTMNSTVALDAMVLGVPALVVGLPNNLTPFVEAGALMGANGAAAIHHALESVLYDQQVRRALASRAEAFAARYRLAPSPGAAERAVSEILGHP